MDSAWEVERLAPLPHQDGPAPQAAFFLFPAALLAGVLAGLLLVIIVGRRHELAEVPARPPCAVEEAARRAREAARRARDAACAGGRGAGHLAEETRHGRTARAVDGELAPAVGCSSRGRDDRSGQAIGILYIGVILFIDNKVVGMELMGCPLGK